MIDDTAAVGARIGSYMKKNYRKMGAEYAKLLPFLGRARDDDESMEKVLKHFEEDLVQLSLAPLVVPSDPPLSNTTAVVATGDDEILAAPEIDVVLVFFSEKGCSDCEEVQEWLDILAESMGGLRVRKHDIQKVATIDLNDTLSDRFSVPEDLRLRTPAICGAEGYLVGESLTFDRLADLIAMSSDIEGAAWLASGFPDR